jgi:hypothetical protein
VKGQRKKLTHHDRKKRDARNARRGRDPRVVKEEHDLELRENRGIRKGLAVLGSVMNPNKPQQEMAHVEDYIRAKRGW